MGRFPQGTLGLSAALLHRFALLAAVISVLATGAPAQAATSRRVGATNVLATVPYPGHPGGIALDGRTIYVDTFNPVDRATDDYDAIFTYDRVTGRLRNDRPNPIKVPRMMSPTPMGLAAIALDKRGLLYVADMNGRILRVDPVTGAQKDYATFPTNSMTSLTAMPDGIAFDKRGNLYVTDGSAPVIWRVPRGGGEAKPWLIDPALPSAWASGLDGVAIDPSGHYLYFTEGFGNGTGVFRVPLNRPQISAVELVHLYAPPAPTPSFADQDTHGIFGVSAIAFGAEGNLYVTLLGYNQVSVLRTNGTEKLRFPSGAGRQEPYYDPLFPALDARGWLYITNLAIRAPAKSAILKAWVRERGLRLRRPAIP